MRTMFVVALFSLGLHSWYRPAGLTANATGQTHVPALPPESITVTVTKPSEAAIKDFVETRAAPTRDSWARWPGGAEDLPFGRLGWAASAVTYVSQRIRDVAAAVGVPVSDDPTWQAQYRSGFHYQAAGLHG